MAQAKKSSAQKKKSTTAKSKSSRKGSNKKPLFSTENKLIYSVIGIFLSLLIGSLVFIEGGAAWATLRNVIFGLFGISAFVLPFFIFFVSLVPLLKKDTREYKIKVIEGFILFSIAIAFLHIVNADTTLEYSVQIEKAFNVFKEYDGEGMKYGFGVYGAALGGLSLMFTGSYKLAAGIFTFLIFTAFLIFFAGTTILNVLKKLKKPVEAVTEYAEEKIDGIKTTVSESTMERRSRKAKNAEEGRRESTHRVELDIPLDDDEPVEDVGVEPILGSPETETLPDADFDDVMAAIGEEPVEEQFVEMPLYEEPPYEEPVEAVADTETPADEEPASYDVDEETGEIFEEPVAEESIPEVVYELPSVELLDEPKRSSKAGNAAELREKGEIIVKTLQSFGVGTRIVEICQSPSVTRFELQPEPGVKISKITALADDLAMNLAASGVRIEAPIPNKNAVGIEVPNAEKAMVTLREILETDAFRNAKSKINVALGRDIQGESTCADLAKMPHLLVAGTTGSGKSVCLNTMIMSLLFNAKPDEVKLIMIDPKKVEFTVYKSIPHLLVPVVSDPRKAAGALSWAVAQMDKRYALFAENGVRNLQSYNAYAVSNGLPKMPQIVIIIDELSDLMMAASNEVEDSICRLAQKARAAGMHLIVATQRPSVDVITGLIKANIPSRIAFAVKSQIDSRTIIDTQGAEKLLGNGDMLYCPVGLSKPVRVQGCYVSDDEIERVIEFVTAQGDVKYDDAVMQEIEINAAQAGGKKKGGAEVEVESASSESGFDDDMTPKAVEVVIEAGMASTTLLQRKLKLGYARAARIIDELSEKGIIGPYEGSKPRKVLITKEQWLQMQANSDISVPKQLSIDDIAPPKAPEDTDDKPDIPDNHNYFGPATNSSGSSED